MSLSSVVCSVFHSIVTSNLLMFVVLINLNYVNPQSITIERKGKLLYNSTLDLVVFGRHPQETQEPALATSECYL